MRHKVSGRKLNRTKKQREALFTNLMVNLFSNGQIKTTVTKAKAVRNLVEKAITTAKKQSLASKRQLAQVFGKRDMVNMLSEKIVKMTSKRSSGYTRIIALGERKGDNSLMARLELIDYVEEKKSAEKPAEKPVAKAKSKPEKVEKKS